MASLTTLQVTLGAGATQATTTTTILCREVIVQNNASHTVRVGDSNVSASRGIALAASSAANSIVLLNPTGTLILLSDIWLIGTQNDVIDIDYVLA